jgi:hypothetical protein
MFVSFRALAINASILSALNIVLVSTTLNAAEAYFQVRCGHEEKPAVACSSDLHLCSKNSPVGCKDRGSIICDDDNNGGSLLDFEGEFTRAVSGNKVILSGESASEGEPVPILTLGPAKTAPKPGKPVLADSWLKFSSLNLTGECSVQLMN